MFPSGRLSTATLLLLASAARTSGQTTAETFTLGAEWRFLRAGEVETKLTGNTQTDLRLRTVGLVSKLVAVDDLYRAAYDADFCANSLQLTTREGSRHRETQVTYDRVTQRVHYLERDVKRDKVVLAKEMDIPACVHEVTGALRKLRAMRTELGSTMELPVSDGKTLARVRVDTLARETVKTPLGEFKAVKYEAFLFNGVLYRRKGRLFVWLSDDDRRLPVQLKIQLPFYIGTVTLKLEKMRNE